MILSRVASVGSLSCHVCAEILFFFIAPSAELSRVPMMSQPKVTFVTYCGGLLHSFISHVVLLCCTYRVRSQSGSSGVYH